MCPPPNPVSVYNPYPCQCAHPVLQSSSFWTSSWVTTKHEASCLLWETGCHGLDPDGGLNTALSRTWAASPNQMPEASDAGDIPLHTFYQAAEEWTDLSNKNTWRLDVAPAQALKSPPTQTQVQWISGPYTHKARTAKKAFSISSSSSLYAFCISTNWRLMNCSNVSMSSACFLRVRTNSSSFFFSSVFMSAWHAGRCYCTVCVCMARS